MKCNGTYLLKVRTRHGTFDFQNQKYYCRQAGSHAFLQAAPDEQAAVTVGLEALAIRLCLDTASYEKARQTLAEMTGQSLLRRQTLCNWVHKIARRIDKRLHQEEREGRDRALPPLAKPIDLYDPATPEVHLFEDGILVKAQKATHEKAGVPQQAQTAHFHQAYFSLVPHPEGAYRFVMAPSDGAFEISTALRTYFCRHWPAPAEPLNLVAITDGATDLRRHLREAFGDGLVGTKEARTALKKQLLALLFHGQVAEALAVVAALPIRHAGMHAKLVSYLTRHADEIIDYALGMISAYLANGQWDQLWNRATGQA